MNIKDLACEQVRFQTPGRQTGWHSKPRWYAYLKPYPEPKAEKPNLYYAVS